MHQVYEYLKTVNPMFYYVMTPLALIVILAFYSQFRKRRSTEY